MTYPDALVQLEDALYGLIDDLTGLPIRIRNSSPQKINEQHIQLHFKDIEPIGYEDDEGYIDELRVTSKEYEVSVDITCHAGTRTLAVIQNILHNLSNAGGLYYKYFDNINVGYLRSSSISRRDFPLDRIQFEERSVITIVFSSRVSITEVADLGSIESVQFTSIKTKITEDVVVDDTLTVNYP